MKRLLVLWLAVSLLLTFAACGYSDPDNANTTKNTENSMAAAEIPDGTHATASATPDNTSDSTALPESGRSVEIWRSDFPVYGGPSYDNYPAGTVEAAGTYTVAEEVPDSEGNLWGKLKSGVGWVDLSLLERENRSRPPVTVARASQTVLDSGNYHYCQADFSSYAYPISISAHEILRDVSFFAIDTADGYERGPALFNISCLDPSRPLVAAVSFPGSASLYGLEFTDQHGDRKIYTIHESGRNGSVNISPFDGTFTQAEPDWKAAYLDYIETLEEEKTASNYSLVYLDRDGIPELFISGSCEASGSRVCSYQGGMLVTVHLRRLGGAYYILQSGLVYNCNGNMGYYSVEIYRLSMDGFTPVFSGLQEDSYETITDENGEDAYVIRSKYYITGEGADKEVTEEAFYAAQAAIFDFSESEDLGYGIYDYSDIREQIEQW